MHLLLKQACDFPYVTALLPSGNIEVYDVETQTLCQTVPPSRDFKFHLLERCTGSYNVPSSAESVALELVEFKFSEPDVPDSTDIEEEEARRSLGGNTNKTGDNASQESSSSGQRSNQQQSKKRGRKSPANSITLAVGEDAVYALTRSTFLQQFEALLAAHKLKEVVMLAQEQQKRVDELKRRSGVLASDIELLV